MNRSEALLRSSMGVIGCVVIPPFPPDPADICFSDLAEAYPNGELVEVLRQDWMTTLIKDTKTNREFSPRTIDTARWAREQIKRQIGGTANVMAQS